MRECEKGKQTWFNAQVGPGQFEVSADCVSCAEDTLSLHLSANSGRNSLGLGVPLVEELAIPLRLTETDLARRTLLQEIIAPMLGTQTVRLVGYRS